MRKISLLFLAVVLFGNLNAQESAAVAAKPVVKVVHDTIYHETVHKDTVFIEVEKKSQYSGEKLITDRPTQNISAKIVPKSSLQVETGAKVNFTPGGQQASSRITAPSALVRWGISEYFEARLFTSFQSFKSPNDLQRTSGLGDVQVGTKIRILDKDDVPTKVAFVSHLIVPTGSRGISYEAYRAINRVSVSHVLMEGVDLGYNLGYNYYTDKNGDLTYSVVLDVAINDKVEIFVEPFGEYTRLLTFNASFDAGLTYLVKDNMQLDFSYGSGINHKMNFMSVGFTWLTGKSESSAK